MSLDINQKKAAESDISIPLMIIAGPGSGKTKTVIQRIVFLLQKNVPSTEILALTFSKKASLEMKERIKKLINVNIDVMVNI